jgi:ATP-dependent DNA helicase RecG
VASIEADIALSKPLTQRTRAVAAVPEDQWFDRKSIRSKPKDLAPLLVAFANAEGGTIVVGMHDGAVEGVALHPQQENGIRQAAIDFTDPPVRVDVERVSCLRGESVDALLVLRVSPGDRVHRTRSGDCYLRVGDETRKLTYAQETELLYDRGQAQYDGDPAVGASRADLDSSLITSFAQHIGHPVDDRILNARSLLTRDGQITNAAVLLFGRDPHVYQPSAFVRVIKYLDAERRTGSRLNISDDVRLEGPVPVVIRDAQDKISELMPVRHTLGADGRFTQTPIVPRDAWLEGLVNAVVHRSYSLAGDHIRVEIFPNRVEIESPGRFPGLVDVASPTRIPRFARNPRIARVCFDFQITQELGEGIRRIFDEMRRAGLEDPLYKQTAGSVRLVLTASPALPAHVVAALPAGSVDVLRLLENTDRQLGTGDIAELLRISRPTAGKRLGALRDAGLVEWHGKSTRDPRACWTAKR